VADRPQFTPELFPPVGDNIAHAYTRPSSTHRQGRANMTNFATVSLIRVEHMGYGTAIWLRRTGAAC